VFPGLPIFLCTWHVTKAWAKQIRSKLAHPTGDLFYRAFKGLHNVMLMPAAETPLRTKVALDAMLDAYEAEFADNPALVKYVRDYWRPKLGAPF
jgi:hypothetical protein